jgi:type II secretory pathway pseudopilin PulG
MKARLHSQHGFALIELLAAIVMINIGILALLLTLNSGALTLRRSAELSTASAVADKHMERFRALAFGSIYLDTTSLSTINADTTTLGTIYRGDSAYSAAQVNQVCSPLVASCLPSQTVTGPDGRSYRVDTYIVWVTPASGDPVRQATVVVRRSTGSASLARTVSTFGENF